MQLLKDRTDLDEGERLAKGILAGAALTLLVVWLPLILLTLRLT